MGVIANPKNFIANLRILSGFSGKKRNVISKKDGGGGSRPFGSFPKKHPFWGFQSPLNLLLLLFRSNLGMLSKFQSEISRGSLPGNVANLSHLCEVACQCNLQLRRGNVSNACKIHET